MKEFFPILVLLVLLAAGCSKEPTKQTSIERSAGRSKSGVSKVKPTSLHKSVFINDIRLEVATIKDTFSTTEIIPIRISVTNTGKEDAKLTFPTPQVQDFSVTDESGKEVWRWPESLGNWPQVITDKTVKPDETYNYFGKIEAGALPPGKFKIAGWLKAFELLEEKITLEISVK